MVLPHSHDDEKLLLTLALIKQKDALPYITGRGFLLTPMVGWFWL